MKKHEEEEDPLDAQCHLQTKLSFLGKKHPLGRQYHLPYHHGPTNQGNNFSSLQLCGGIGGFDGALTT